MKAKHLLFVTLMGMAALIFGGLMTAEEKAAAKFDPTTEALSRIAEQKVGKYDWPQWGGSSLNNNTPYGKNIPTTWDPVAGTNIKWKARLGSQTYGNPIVANGKVFVGTNNAGYAKRFPNKEDPDKGINDVDLGCMVCFDVKTGKCLWQHSNRKLPTGRIHDWPQQGVCSAGYVVGDRLYYVSNRGCIVCLDTEGFHDGENDGEFKNEFMPKDKEEQLIEADVVWEFNMMKELKVQQHNMASCSLTGVGDLLFVCTSNGVDFDHKYIPSKEAASFICIDRNTREIYWSDNSPGNNILHGQWSSPAYAVIDGTPQVIFAGGDGYVYSFYGGKTKDGKAKLLWKFDTNPKESKWILGGRGTRNNIISVPVIYDGYVYIANGQDPEHGVGTAHLYCLDPRKRGDISAELVFNKNDPKKEIAHKREQACEPDKGDFTKPNPNSGIVWHYHKKDWDGNGKIDYTEEFRRAIGSCAIKDDILYIADLSGVIHCLDAKTGKPYWTEDTLSECWCSPLIVDGHVYIPNGKDGVVMVFKHGKKKELVNQIEMNAAIDVTPIVANNVLYVATTSTLYAIEKGAKLGE